MKKISLKAIYILEYIAWLSSSNYTSYLTTKSKNIQKENNGFKIDDASKVAVLALIRTAEILFNNTKVKDKFTFQGNSCLLENLIVIENLYSKNNFDTDIVNRQMIRNNSEKLFRDLVRVVKMEIEEIEKTGEKIAHSEKEKMECEFKKYSKWMCTLLPLCIQDFCTACEVSAWYFIPI